MNYYTKEIMKMAELIMKTHDGQAYFDFNEASELTGICRKYIPVKLHEAGITCATNGRKKHVSALDIAEMMTTRRIAPIDSN